MADFNGIDPLLNTIDGMECIVNNVGHDDDVVSCPGVNWFKFNDVAAATMYASGNSFIGIGTNAEQLKVCRRDAKMWYLYRQEGTIYDRVRFFKLRWQGYAIFSNKSTEYALQYELFLFDDGRMFLNVVQTPTNSENLGTSALVCGESTYQLTIGTNDNCPVYYTFTPTDETGTAWTVSNEKILIRENFKHLIRAGSMLYTVQDGAAVALAETTQTAALFAEYGIDKPPASNILKTFVNPSVLAWAGDGLLPTLKATVTGDPYPHTVESLVDMTSSSITGILSLTANYTGNVGIKYSVDEKATYTNEITLAEFLNTDTTALFAAVSATRRMWLQFILFAGAKLIEFQIKYKN